LAAGGSGTVQVFENAVDDFGLGDEGNYPHFFAASGTHQRINF
jgi:hypothetical protein